MQHNNSEETPDAIWSLNVKNTFITEIVTNLWGFHGYFHLTKYIK